MRTVPLKTLLSVMIGIMVLDQATKAWILGYFTVNTQRIRLLPILDFVLVWNRGISWGLFNNAGECNAIIFSLLAAVISVVLGIVLWKTQEKMLAWALSFIIGGALGNLMDRIRFGGVVDFLYFHWQSWSFPAFNIADTAVTVGAGLMIWKEVIHLKERKEDKK